MKYFFLVLLIFVVEMLQAQIPPFDCDQSQIPMNTVFFSNIDTNLTSNSTNVSGMYLCGPNTKVVDTSSITNPGFSCRYAYVNQTCTLIAKPIPCIQINSYYVKTGGTLIFPVNTPTNGVYVLYETGANIVDNSNGISTYSCAALAFPTVNCSTTDLNNIDTEINLAVGPNPFTDYIIINFPIQTNSSIKCSNITGETLIQEKIVTKQFELQTEHLPSGVYFLTITNSFGLKTIKILKVDK